MLTDNISDDEILPPTENISQRKSIKNSIQQISNEIIKAYQINAFKYVDLKYENRGKIGLAILGSKINNNFSILLYGKGNTPLTNANIDKNFDLSSGRDLYVSFYDSKSENWSLLFENNESYIDFYNRITILKLINTKQDLILIDIKNGEGNIIRENDSCEAEIIINNVKNYEINSILYNSETYETNKFLRFKVGNNKLIPAIDKGVLGMMKGGHRIICISSQSLLIKGGSIKIGNDSIILIHIKIIRIKGKTEKLNLTNDLTDNEISLPNINFSDKNNDSEIGQQYSKKAELINLMQRIGKPILQFQNNEQLSKDVVTSSNYTNYPNTTYEHVADYISRPLSSVVNVPSYNNQLLPLNNQNPMINTVHQFYPQLTNLPTVSDNNLVFTETRQHNTEMRIAISKLQDKIDKISDKLDSNNSIQKVSISRHLDAENVFENIKRIIDENEILKNECSQKSDIIDSQNKRINELLNKNQRYLEDSRNVMDRNTITFNNTESENQIKILKLEEEKLDLIRSLSKKTSDLGMLEIKTESLNKESQDYRNKSLEFSEQLNKLTTELNDYKIKNQSLLTEVGKLKEDFTTTSVTKEELQKNKNQSLENEKKFQQYIDTLKSSVKEANNNIEQVKSDCDLEIMEMRQHCNKEIEDLRNKLRQERRMTSNKSSDLETEIESINKEWEIKLDEFKKSEYSKVSKINEKNNQLMIENSNLNHAILDLKNQLSVINSDKSVKTEELLNNNRQLQRQVIELQSKVCDIESLRSQNNNYTKEIAKLLSDSKELVEIKNELESTMQRKEELESMIITLTEELKTKPVENIIKKISNENVEEQIKMIMNDVFKKIKLEFTLDKIYGGKEIIEKCMIVIRDSTVSLIKSNDTDDESVDEVDNSESDYSDSDSNAMKNNDTLNAVSSLPIISIKEPLDNFIDESISNVKEDLSNNLINTSYADQEIKDQECDINVEKESAYSVERDDDFEIKRDISVNEGNDEIITKIDETKIKIIEELQDNDDIITKINEMEVENIEYLQDNDKLININELTNNNSETDINDICKTDQDSENLFNDSEIKKEKVCEIDLNVSLSTVNQNDNTQSEKKKERTALLSSDDEEDVSGLFEQLNKNKKEENVQQSKPVSSISDDDLKSSFNDSEIQKEKVSEIDLNIAVSTANQNQNVNSEKNKGNSTLLSSDDEEDVSGFFEQLNKKKKEEKVQKSKPISSIGDDDFSWLN